MAENPRSEFQLIPFGGSGMVSRCDAFFALTIAADNLPPSDCPAQLPWCPQKRRGFRG